MFAMSDARSRFGETCRTAMGEGEVVVTSIHQHRAVATERATVVTLAS